MRQFTDDEILALIRKWEEDHPHSAIHLVRYDLRTDAEGELVYDIEDEEVAYIGTPQPYEDE